MSDFWHLITHFKPEEFDSPDEPGSGAQMDRNFMMKLNFARELDGHPWRINSGYRTQAHNKAIGGEDNSAHCRGQGADIRVADSARRYAILKALMGAGFKRFGIYPSWIHVDDGLPKDGYPQEVIWYK